MGSNPTVGSVPAALLAAGFAALAAVGIGMPRRRLGGAEGIVLAFGLGTAALSLAAASLGAVGWIRSELLVAICLPFALRGAWALRGAVGPVAWGGLFPIERAAAVAAVGCAAISFVASFAPVVDFDALSAHAFLPDLWLRAGRTIPTPWSMAMHNVQGAHALYLYPMAIGGAEGAKVFHAAAGGIAILSAYALGKALSGEERPGAAGVWAASLFATFPAVVFLFRLLMVDLLEAALSGGFALAFVRAIEEEDPESRRAAEVRAAVLFGAMAGTKVTAWAVFPAAAAAFVIRRGVRGGLAAAGFLVGGGVLFSAPWWFRNLEGRGNPFFSAGRVAAFLLGRGRAAGRGPAEYLCGLFAFVLGRRSFELPGPGVFFLGVLPGIVRSSLGRRAARAAAIVAGLPLLVWAALGARAPWMAMRYSLPSVLVLAALAGAGLARRGPGRKVAAFLAAVAVLGNAAGGTRHAERLTGSFFAAAGFVAADRYRDAHDPGWRIRRRAAGLRLLVLGMRGYGLGPRAVVPYVHDMPRYEGLFEGAGTPEEIARRLRAEGFEALLVDIPTLLRVRAQYGVFSSFDPEAEPIRSLPLRFPVLAAVPPESPEVFLLAVPAQ